MRSCTLGSWLPRPFPSSTNTHGDPPRAGPQGLDMSRTVRGSHKQAAELVTQSRHTKPATLSCSAHAAPAGNSLRF